MFTIVMIWSQILIRLIPRYDISILRSWGVCKIWSPRVL
jgi:hypothetical protein